MAAGSNVPAPSPGVPRTDPLDDPLRIAAARRLLVEVPGPAAYGRLSALAARLLVAGHAKVTIFAEHDTVIGGFGLPPGVVGGPALLTGALSAIVVRQGAPLVVPVAAADPLVADLPAVLSGQVASYLGAPLVAHSGHVVGALALYDEAPREWTADAAELLAQLASSVVAELELSAAQSAAGKYLARLDVALEASSVGIWEVDLRAQEMDWDQRCAAIFGLPDAIRMSMARVFDEFVHPDDREPSAAVMQQAIDDRAQYSVELRCVRPDGVVRWTLSRGRVLVGPQGEPVRILGTVVDLTEAREEAALRLAAVQRAAALAEVAAELSAATRIAELADLALRGAQVLGAASSALAAFDPDGVLWLHMTSALVDAVRAGTDVELPPDGVPIPLDDSAPTQWTARHGERVLLPNPEEAVARFPAMAQLNELLGARALAALPLRVEDRLLGAFVVVWPDDHPFPADELELLDGLAAQIALSVSRLRSDAERAAAVEAMAAANERLQLLADVGEALTGTLDITEQLAELSDLVVPALGDWCWIVVADEQGRLEELACSHRDPARGDEVARYVQAMVAGMTADAAARIVIGSGRPLVLPVIGGERIVRALPDPETRARLARLDAAAGVVVPLLAGGQTLGALGLFTGADRRPLGRAEVDTAVEIGRRAGLALHHARLYGQQRALADALQRSMLTDPPQPAGVEIVVRYVPAAAGAEIGGDWYDAFLQRSGDVVVAIGDVVGHDTRAAAAMGQMRGLLRGISYSSGGSPAEVLTELDRAVRGLAIGSMATALVARLERADGGPADGGPADGGLRPGQTRLRWASAGHPPPLVVGPDGKVTVLSVEPADLLIGVAPDAPRADRVAVVDRGSSVLLYTDGLVERRDRDIDAGTEALVHWVREAADLPLDQLCDRVLERLFLPDAEDDVALLAVRLTA